MIRHNIECSIDAVVFDLDGVITDTAHYHYLAWKNLADELGIKIDEVFNEQLKGVSRLESLELILQAGKRQNDFTLSEKMELAEKKNLHYGNFLNRLSANNIMPGILPLIAGIKADGTPVGLASVSRNAPTILEALQLKDVFDYIVDAAKISRPKPDPEIFLTACQGLGASPLRSIGIEDAVAGVEAIKKSGMFAVGVGCTLERADYKVETTEHLQWAKIKEAYDIWIHP